jgi:hypothetical protein
MAVYGVLYATIENNTARSSLTFVTPGGEMVA